ncbi:MAG: hypothetical protein ACE5FI_02670 [Anaerolineales bacterium]
MKSGNSNQSEAFMQLSGRRLTVARALWVVFVFIILVFWIASLKPYYDELRAPCVGEMCPSVAVSPEEADALRQAGYSMEFYAGFHTGTQAFSGVIHILLGLVIFWRRSADRMGLFVSLTLVAIGTSFFSEVGISLVNQAPDLSLVFDLIFTLSTTTFVVLFYIFPDGRFTPGWTRPAAILLAAYLVIGSFLTRGIVWFAPGLAGVSVIVIMLLAFLVGLYAQIYRYRRVSTPVQRQQTKWVVFGLGAVVLVIFVWSLGIDLFPLPPGPARLFVNLYGVAVIFIVLLFFPLSLAIAILRYRLWDIDILVNRALVYGGLTGTLALVYFGSVVLLQDLFTAVSGQRSSIAIVISTLGIAALFNPLRHRVQDFIDRRFYRRRYNAAQALARFAVAARDEVDMERLTAALLEVVEETMQPSSASLWLKR